MNHELDELERAGLAGCEDVAVRCFAEVEIFVVGEHAVEVPEGFLLGNDGDVILLRVADELGYVLVCDGSGAGCGHGVAAVAQREFEVR